MPANFLFTPRMDRIGAIAPLMGTTRKRAGTARRMPARRPRCSVGFGEVSCRRVLVEEPVDVHHPGLDLLALAVALDGVERLRPEFGIALDRRTHLALEDRVDRVFCAVDGDD